MTRCTGPGVVTVVVRGPAVAGSRKSESTSEVLPSAWVTANAVRSSDPVRAGVMVPCGMLAINASARPLARSPKRSPGEPTVPSEHSGDMGGPPWHGPRDECAVTRSAASAWTRTE
ncbi:hypothetical protein [Kocuria marina]|uniref:hypothetical protein n=1 Tax=Kocuria marina TaxID=223184 RepID=UPI00117B5C30